MQPREVIALAERVFGDKARACAWLRAPKRKFDGRAPLQLLATPEGGQIVEEALVSIDEGYAA